MSDRLLITRVTYQVEAWSFDGEHATEYPTTVVTLPYRGWQESFAAAVEHLRREIEGEPAEQPDATSVEGVD